MYRVRNIERASKARAKKKKFDGKKFLPPCPSKKDHKMLLHNSVDLEGHKFFAQNEWIFVFSVNVVAFHRYATDACR